MTQYQIGDRVMRKGNDPHVGIVEAIFPADGWVRVDRARVRWLKGTRRVNGGTSTRSTVAMKSLLPADDDVVATRRAAKRATMEALAEQHRQERRTPEFKESAIRQYGEQLAYRLFGEGWQEAGI